MHRKQRKWYSQPTVKHTPTATPTAIAHIQQIILALIDSAAHSVVSIHILNCEWLDLNRMNALHRLNQKQQNNEISIVLFLLILRLLHLLFFFRVSFYLWRCENKILAHLIKICLHFTLLVSGVIECIV